MGSDVFVRQPFHCTTYSPSTAFHGEICFLRALTTNKAGQVVAAHDATKVHKKQLKSVLDPKKAYAIAITLGRIKVCPVRSRVLLFRNPSAVALLSSLSFSVSTCVYEPSRLLHFICWCETCTLVILTLSMPPSPLPPFRSSCPLRSCGACCWT